MASVSSSKQHFVVKDQSTAQINKINAALKKLFATANSLKSIKVDIKVNDKGITQAIANINRLKSAMRGLSSHDCNIKANTSGLAAAQKQLTQLRAQAATPITGPRIATRERNALGLCSGTSRTPATRAVAPRAVAAVAAAADRDGRGCHRRLISEALLKVPSAKPVALRSAMATARP